MSLSPFRRCIAEGRRGRARRPAPCTVPVPALRSLSSVALSSAQAVPAYHNGTGFASYSALRSAHCAIFAIQKCPVPGVHLNPSQAVGTVGEVGPVGAGEDWDEGRICRGRGCWPFARRGGDYDAGGRPSGRSCPSRDAHRRSAGRDTGPDEGRSDRRSMARQPGTPKPGRDEAVSYRSSVETLVATCANVNASEEPS